MNGVKFLTVLSVTIASLTVKGCSSSSSGVKGPPSPPRNLRRKTVGVAGVHREYWVLWTASKDNGGLPVNYTLKACSNETHYCKFISNPECQANNVISTSKTFSCIMQWKVDFLPCGEFCDFILCVVAFNDAGENESCIFEEVVDAYGATPRPPLSFRVGIEDGEVTVQWEERDVWIYAAFIDRLYTVMYYPVSGKFVVSNETKEVWNQTSISLSGLEVFTTYCFFLMIQIVDGERNTRSAHSDVLGPKCLRSPAGDPISPPRIVAHQNFIYPGHASLRNVSVQWKLASNSSWKGTPYQYHISCEYHVPMGWKSLGNKCLYHTDAATNNTVLHHLNSADSYNVYVEMCNEEGLCSGRGKSYLVEPEGASSLLTRTNTDEGKKHDKSEVWVILVVTVVSFILALLVVLLYFAWRRRKRKTKMTYLAQNFPQEGPGYQFSHDVFVSYSAKDDDWVKDNLQPLFDGSNIKYIIHSRDFIPGKAFFDNMAANRVYSSRKVILVMSKNYLSSGFCKDEMQMALFRAARNDENGYLIVVKIDGVKPQDIPKSLRHQTFIDYTSKEEETTWKKKILEFVSSANRSLSVSANGGLARTSDTISLIRNEFELKRKKNKNVSRETNDQAYCKSLL
ncbi:uncharacterized protein [Montipora foliosa]|uniref:uncharacterized protein n=1 Tax=Montipora foliosa TaxID=591990 RepID=UPI0035F1AD81